ncbi:uncharacterized protein LOC126235782 isoform X2 [Schistocerca nitens]|uniref:uncharacterized protein LOC126235782 isoform X2 n=1 Tax=Schistocerca nitens TaxID=7011 RepID=UPI0021188C58|nr:uncharacterized protein LOC126235782 isoform X2 [Schistocerca nitens]
METEAMKQQLQTRKPYTAFRELRALDGDQPVTAKATGLAGPEFPNWGLASATVPCCHKLWACFSDHRRAWLRDIACLEEREIHKDYWKTINNKTLPMKMRVTVKRLNLLKMGP